MKRVFLIFIFILIFSVIYCQIQVGVKVGYNLLQILQADKHYKPSAIYYDRNSFPISIYICQRNHHLINFHLELEYMKRSYSMEEDWGGLGAPGEANFKIVANYLTIIMDPQFVFGKKIKTFLFPGIYVAIPVYSSANGTESEPYYPLFSTYTISGNAQGYIQDVELGALAGFGIDIPINKRLMISLQNILSISLLPTKSHWTENSYRFLQYKLEIGIAYHLNCEKKKEKEDK